MTRTRAALIGSISTLAIAGSLLPVTAASAVSPDVVISEVYGGGGNSGASWTNDFVELYNAGTAPVDVNGWSVQYASSSGSTWQVTSLSGTIQPGAHYLVQEDQGSGGTKSLPAADATGGIAMSGSHGKVALVTGSTRLACGSACHGATGVRDYVGYGDANDYEGSGPAPGLSNSTSDSRSASGADTDDNSADFTEGTPSPTNSSGDTTGHPVGIPDLQIHDIQGAAQTSPFSGKAVLDVTGVVTATAFNGFWMETDHQDADPATSEGIFVYTYDAGVQPGDAVTVSGEVSEYRPGFDGLTSTEIDASSVTVTSSGNPLPADVVVGRDGLMPPGSVIEDDSDGNVERSNTFDPDQDGIDFWESLEGMRVEVEHAQVVGPTNKFGEIPVVPDGAGLRTPRGGIVARERDFNPERVIVGPDLLDGGLPAANVGDHFAGPLTGVLSYDYSNFRLLPTTAPAVVSGGLTREVTQDDHGSELSVASFNVENLDPTDPQSKFDGLAREIVHNLRSPDILGLEEVQDNNGATDDGTVAANQTLTRLTQAIRAAGGPSYQWREIDPVNDAEGGEPGGNIRNVLLFDPGSSLAFVDHGQPSSTEPTEVRGSGEDTYLTRSPGRIDPDSPAWDDSRVPLVGQFTWRDHSLFVITNHFASKGGDDPLFGRWQQPEEPSAEQRHQQAQEVRDFADALLAADPGARVVVLGDLNDFQFSQSAKILVGSGATALTDLPRTLPANEQYTYDYEGNSEVLDHILLSPALVRYGFAYDVVHVNAEFADQISDHDPQVVRLGPST
ncbi:MAG TPA: lamin tail domain-containing protein [Nocardioidaceae bacterium]|nr:lamin tail domain-containing protein [Nocardioidaceae bacterium]